MYFMSLQDIIKKNRKAILDRCFDLIAATYPPETSQLLKQEKDRFLNPVGHTLRHEIKIIFDELAGHMDVNKLNTALENIIKIRAVQEFAASEAVGFIFHIKKAVTEITCGTEQKEGFKDRWLKEAESQEGRRSENNETGIIYEFFEFEQRIDKLALMAFDIYMQCREKIHEIKAKGLNLKVNYGK